MTLRKHAYSNILKISPPKTKSFQIKNLIILVCFRDVFVMIINIQYKKYNKWQYNNVRAIYTLESNKAIYVDTFGYFSNLKLVFAET